MKEILFAIMCLWGVLVAQPFTLDTSFQPDFDFIKDWQRNTGHVNDLYEESDGRVLLVGVFTEWPPGQSYLWHEARFFPNGSLDYSWNSLNDGSNGRAYVQVVNNTYYFSSNSGVIASDSLGNLLHSTRAIPYDINCSSRSIPYIFPDGRMILGVFGCKYPSPDDFQYRIWIGRTRPDGYLDSTFTHRAFESISKIVKYDDARLLVYGTWLYEYDSIPVSKLIRIDTSGNLDTTFHLTSLSGYMGARIFVQDDGKILFSGKMQVGTGNDSSLLVRLNSDGTLDSSFNNFNGAKVGPNAGVTGICRTSDGGLLLGGRFQNYQGYPRGSIVKTDADGFIDLNYFNGSGIDSTVDKQFNYPAVINNIKPGQNDTYYVMGDFLRFDDQDVKPIIRIFGLSHTVSVDPDLPQADFHTWQSPNQETVQYSWRLPVGIQEATLEWLDIQGRVVQELPIPQAEGKGKWGPADLTSGIYLYVLRHEGQVLARGKVKW